MTWCDRCGERVLRALQLTLSNGRMEQACQLCLASEAAELLALRAQSRSPPGTPGEEHPFQIFALDQQKAGRKPIDPNNPLLAIVREMYEDRYMKVVDIARTLKIARATAYRYVRHLRTRA